MSTARKSPKLTLAAVEIATSTTLPAMSVKLEPTASAQKNPTVMHFWTRAQTTVVAVASVKTITRSTASKIERSKFLTHFKVVLTTVFFFFRSDRILFKNSFASDSVWASI